MPCHAFVLVDHAHHHTGLLAQWLEHSANNTKAVSSSLTQTKFLVMVILLLKGCHMGLTLTLDHSDNVDEEWSLKYALVC